MNDFPRYKISITPEMDWSAERLQFTTKTEFWANKVAGKVTFRRYPGEGHDVQYRHWDQLLLDVAGHGEQTLVCEHGRAKLVAGLVQPAQLAAGATLGICAWQAGRREQPR